MFNPNMTENDDAWKVDSRESIIDVHCRVVSFLKEVATFRENNIVVISHGVWIETCFKSFCPEALDHGSKRVHNCNIFVGECICRDGEFLSLENVHQIH